MSDLRYSKSVLTVCLLAWVAFFSHNFFFFSYPLVKKRKNIKIASIATKPIIDFKSNVISTIGTFSYVFVGILYQLKKLTTRINLMSYTAIFFTLTLFYHYF